MRPDRIIRAPRNSEHPYMQLMRKIPQDIRMTLEERGFLIYMLSLPSSWEANPDHLCRTQGIGEKKLRTIFKKLQSLGYCQVSQIRDSGGKFSHNEYLIFEECIDTPSHNECEPSGNSCRAAETAGPFLPDGDQEPHTYTQREDTREYINTPYSPVNGTVAAPPECGVVYSSEVREVATKMVELLQEAVPVYRAPHNMNPMLEQVRLLLEYDKQDASNILDTFQWAVNDNEERDKWKGWQSVISVPTKGIKSFRTNFIKIYGQMRSQPKRKFAPSSDNRKALAALMSMDTI